MLVRDFTVQYTPLHSGIEINLVIDIYYDVEDNTIHIKDRYGHQDNLFLYALVIDQLKGYILEKNGICDVNPDKLHWYAYTFKGNVFDVTNLDVFRLSYGGNTTIDSALTYTYFLND